MGKEMEREGEEKMIGEEKGEEGCPQLGSLDLPMEERREGERGNEGSLNWASMQAVFSARQHAIARYMLSLVRLSICLSVTWVDQSKTAEVRITQPSPQSSPMTLVSWRLTSP